MRSTRVVLAFVSVACGLAAVDFACSVGDTDYIGKSCPCPPGYACVSGQCALGGDDGGVDSSDGLIVVSNLHSVWAAANDIRWEFSVSGARDNFGSFALVVTSNTPDAGGVKTWTAVDNPELGRFDLPNPQGTIDPVLGTITDTHDPDTTYFATLIATDTQGHTTTSNQASAVTQIVPANRFVIFSEGEPSGGFHLPSNGVVKPGCGAAGTTNCWEYTPDTDTDSCTPRLEAGAADCYENMRWEQFDIDASISATSFATNAYLEFYYRYSGSKPSYWSQIWFDLNDAAPCSGNTYCNWTLHPLTIPAGQPYRRMQIPLRGTYYNEDDDARAPMSYADFMSGVSGLCAIGGTWMFGATLDLDEIAIWY